MLHGLRGGTDFAEKIAHDYDELRPEARHNYNEAVLEDAAAGGKSLRRSTVVTTLTTQLE